MDKIEITSKKKWLIIGIIIAIVNPVFSGLIISLAYLTEPKLRKQGKIILAISIVWAFVMAYLIELLNKGGYL